MPGTTARDLLTDLYAAAVRGADPGPATAAALARVPMRPTRRRWLVAVGKAAPGMARTAVEWLARERGATFAGGVLVAAEPVTWSAPGASDLEVVAGDHPVPGPASLDAAAEVGLLAARVRADDEVLVLLSGGASSLMAAPAAGVDVADLAVLFERLQGAGTDILVTNHVRKRFLRWAAGRLAVALAPARVRCLLVSDVAGDDPAIIGSGPCEPDALTAAAVLDLVDRTALRQSLPPALRAHLTATVRGAVPETPKPGDPAFARVEREVILANRDAVAAAARRAETLGMDAEIVGDELRGEAADRGREFADRLLTHRRERRAGVRPLCVIAGGETTVTLPLVANVGRGGRCQELALAAAERLGAADADAGDAHILAAGTDGRDGATDAAGAMVDAATWEAVRLAGRDPARDLRTHEARAALLAAGALLPAWATGTNVRDVVIGLVL